ncbi:hypothetical protein FA13DRAFT_375196 [Coprinellus micaceus]|uniref:Uncharacterized protein n=1 Tax=Coprinellus micaceus TaxID=71717 RepID=A0A4Y7SEG0_COPMI|nr:hypothetical protein FA13DRAFT_375196 [Coprinellus micaceus]
MHTYVVSLCFYRLSFTRVTVFSRSASFFLLSPLAVAHTLHTLGVFLGISFLLSFRLALDFLTLAVCTLSLLLPSSDLIPEGLTSMTTGALLVPSTSVFMRNAKRSSLPKTRDINYPFPSLCPPSVRPSFAHPARRVAAPWRVDALNYYTYLLRARWTSTARRGRDSEESNCITTCSDLWLLCSFNCREGVEGARLPVGID